MGFMSTPQLHLLFCAVTNGTFDGWTPVVETLDRLSHRFRRHGKSSSRKHAAPPFWHGLDELLDLFEEHDIRLVVVRPRIDTATTGR